MIVYVNWGTQEILTKTKKEKLIQNNIEQAKLYNSFEDFVCLNFTARDLLELIQTKTNEKILSELNESFIEEIKKNERAEVEYLYDEYEIRD